MDEAVKRAREAAARAMLRELREQHADIEDEGFPHVQIGGDAVNVRTAINAAIDAYEAAIAETHVRVPRAALDEVIYDVEHSLDRDGFRGCGSCNPLNGEHEDGCPVVALKAVLTPSENEEALEAQGGK